MMTEMISSLLESVNSSDMMASPFRYTNKCSYVNYSKTQGMLQ